jgi:hypothetical protein
MKVLILFFIGLISGSVTQAQDQPVPNAKVPHPPVQGGGLRANHFEIVNGEEITIRFGLACGGKRYDDKLDPGGKSEYQCDQPLGISIKTKLAAKDETAVSRTLRPENRYQLFWDSKNNRYDIRRIE